MDKETKAAFIVAAPIILILWLVTGYVAGYLLAALAIIGAVILAAAIVWWIDFVFKHFL
jgi:uncharacterized membrane protein YraQ (UPF0718 family)